MASITSGTTALPTAGVGAAAKSVGAKREAPITYIPAGSESPYSCFPMVCMFCSTPVPLRSPVVRMLQANQRILAQFRCLAESAAGRPNDAILREQPRGAK
jgi:hypothetical protein